MTNLNTTPNPFGKHSFRDNAVDSAASQTYEFDIDGSVAASVENTATAKPKFGRRSFLTGFAGAALACMLAFGVQGVIIDPATAGAPLPLPRLSSTPTTMRPWPRPWPPSACRPWYTWRPTPMRAASSRAWVPARAS